MIGLSLETVVCPSIAQTGGSSKTLSSAVMSSVSGCEPNAPSVKVELLWGG